MKVTYHTHYIYYVYGFENLKAPVVVYIFINSQFTQIVLATNARTVLACDMCTRKNDITTYIYT